MTPLYIYSGAGKNGANARPAAVKDMVHVCVTGWVFIIETRAKTYQLPAGNSTVQCLLSESCVMLCMVNRMPFHAGAHRSQVGES